MRAMTMEEQTRQERSAVDLDLVTRLQDGDQGALEGLYDRYAGPCHALSIRILRDENLARDVVQEVFLALWRNPGSYDPRRGPFSSWVLSLTHHKAVDSVRREESQRRRAAAETLESEREVGPDVEEQVLTHLQSERVQGALNVLPPAQREVLVLAYFGGHTQQEIAALTGAPLGTVKSRTLLAMRRLRQELGDGTMETGRRAGQ